MHITELQKLSAVEITPSNTRLFYYSKATIPTKGQAKLRLFRCGSLYEVIVQINTFQQYYPLLVGLADNTRMGILKYDADKIKQIEASWVENMPVQHPPGQLTLKYQTCLPVFIWGAYVSCAPHTPWGNMYRYSAPMLPVMKGVMDKYIHKGQLVRVAKVTPWISNMVTYEYSAADSVPAKVRIYWTHPKQLRRPSDFNLWRRHPQFLKRNTLGQIRH